MQILPNTFAVFWSFPSGGVQFHADVPAASAREAAATFHALFPGDRLCSVRGKSGRFEGYKA
jgi:hypothetical protein